MIDIGTPLTGSSEGKARDNNENVSKDVKGYQPSHCRELGWMPGQSM
jgi:hypothetical protein